MFAVYCPLHGCQVLLTARRVISLCNLGEGVIALELKCYDGQRLLLLTGSKVNPAGPDEPGPALPPNAPQWAPRQSAISRCLDVEPPGSGS